MASTLLTTLFHFVYIVVSTTAHALPTPVSQTPRKELWTAPAQVTTTVYLFSPFLLLVLLFDICLVQTCIMCQQQMQSWLHVWYPNQLLSPASMLATHMIPSPGTPCKIDSQCVYTNTQGVNIVSCSNGRYASTIPFNLYLLLFHLSDICASNFSFRCAGLNQGDPCGKTDDCFPPLTCGPDNTCITPQNAVGPPPPHSSACFCILIRQ